MRYSILTDTDKLNRQHDWREQESLNPLDREEQHVHYLKVEARDQAREESLSSSPL